MTTLQAAGTVPPGDATAVDTFIDGFFAERCAAAAGLGPRYSTLWHHLAAEATGGKRFRPELAVLTAGSLSGSMPPGSIPVAAAFELLHTAFLLHDDVIDEDTTRRGRRNLMGRMAGDVSGHGGYGHGATVWGRASAILGGDLLIHGAQSVIASAGVSEHARVSLLELFDRIMFTTAAGELDDVAFSTVYTPTSLAEVLAVSERKTAQYSFQGPLVAGAIVAGAGKSVQESLDRIGGELGIAFQLRDDVLGVFGRPDVTGKSAESDLRSGTMTPLLFTALHNDESGAIRRLVESVRAGGDADIDRMRRLLVSTKAVDIINDRIRAHTATAVRLIARSTLPVELRERLLRIAAEATERQL